jgi:beta-galactosidase GanA
VFGKDADEFFHAYSIAHFVEQVTAAGEAAYPIPMSVNAALRDSFRDQDPYDYSSGGPTWNVLDIWKAAAPSIDIIGPDIYLHDHRTYIRTLDLYMRPDNALFVPETGNGQEIARYFFEAVGRGGLGFAPFGMDFTGYVNSPLGAARLDEETIEAFARNYKLVEPMMRELAALRPQAHSVGLVAFRAAAKRQLSPSQRMRSSGSRRLACVIRLMAIP